MADAARFGFAVVADGLEIEECVIAAADTNAYAVGDPVASTGALHTGVLPSGKPTQGALVVTRAVSGSPVRGVIVGVEKSVNTSGASLIPAVKDHAYAVLVRSAENAVFEIQCDNAAALSSIGAGATASFAAGSPNGSVSGFYANSASFGTGADLAVVGITKNLGANSTLLARFINTEFQSQVSGGGAQIARDLGGTTAAPQVIGLRGLDLPASPATPGHSLQWNGTALEWAAGGGLPSGMTYASPATTTGDAVLEVLGTFNGAGETLTGLRVDVTDTASATSSLLLDLRVGGATKASAVRYGGFRATSGGTGLPSFAFAESTTSGMSWDPSGSNRGGCYVTAGSIVVGFSGLGVGIASDSSIRWAANADGLGSPDLFLHRDAANTLAQRNGTNAQESRIYRNYVDGSNFGYTGLKQDATAGFILDSVYSGSVSAPTNLLDVQANGASKFVVDKIGNVFIGSGVTSYVYGQNTGSFLRLGNDVGITNQASGRNVFLNTGGGVHVVGNKPFGWAASEDSTASTMTLQLWGGTTSDVLEQRRGTAAQTFNLYNTYSDSSNYERGVFAWSSNELLIGTQAAGTGALRRVRAKGRWEFDNPSANSTSAAFELSTPFLSSIGAINQAILLSGFDQDAQYNTICSGNNASTDINGVIAFKNVAGWAQEIGFFVNQAGSPQTLAQVIAAGPALNITPAGLLQFGGTTASFSALKRSGATLQVRLADDSDFGELVCKLPTSNPGPGILWNNAGTPAIGT